MSFRRMVRDAMQPKSKMLEKMQTSIAWIILISMCALTITMKVRGYDIVFDKYNIENDHSFYVLPFGGVVLFLYYSCMGEVVNDD